LSAQALDTAPAQYEYAMTKEELDAWFEETIARLAEEDREILIALS
jgi:hypothetical protein